MYKGGNNGVNRISVLSVLSFQTTGVSLSVCKLQSSAPREGKF